MSQHILTIETATNWTLTHPDECHDDQLGCPLTWAVSNQLGTLAAAYPDDVKPGRYQVALNEDGEPELAALVD